MKKLFNISSYAFIYITLGLFVAGIIYSIYEVFTLNL